MMIKSISEIDLCPKPGMVYWVNCKRGKLCKALYPGQANGSAGW